MSQKQLFLSSASRSIPHRWAIVYHTQPGSLEVEFVGSTPKFFKTCKGAWKWFNLRYKMEDFIEPEAVQIELVSRIEEVPVVPKKASDIKVGTRVALLNSSYEHGTVVSNSSRQGDEVVIVEWDELFIITPANVNDLIILED